MFRHHGEKQKPSLGSRCLPFFTRKKHKTRPQQDMMMTDGIDHFHDLINMQITKVELAICEDFHAAGILTLTTSLDRYCSALPEHMQNQTLAIMMNELYLIFTLKKRAHYDTDAHYVDESMTTDFHIHAEKNAAGDLTILFDLKKKLGPYGKCSHMEETSDKILLDANLLSKLSRWQQKLQINMLKLPSYRLPATADLMTDNIESLAFVRLLKFINNVSRFLQEPSAL